MLRFVKTLIMLHKQPIKAKKTQQQQGNCLFPLPTTSDTMKGDRCFIHSLISVFCLLWILSSWFHPLWICLYLLLLSLFLWCLWASETDRRTDGGLSSHFKKSVSNGKRSEMEAEISMRMQKITFLLCVTLDHSLILEAEVGGGGGAGSPGEWRLFPKMPSASCII